MLEKRKCQEESWRDYAYKERGKRGIYKGEEKSGRAHVSTFCYVDSGLTLWPVITDAFLFH